MLSAKPCAPLQCLGLAPSRYIWREYSVLRPLDPQSAAAYSQLIEAVASVPDLRWTGRLQIHSLDYQAVDDGDEAAVGVQGGSQWHPAVARCMSHVHDSIAMCAPLAARGCISLVLDLGHQPGLDESDVQWEVLVKPQWHSWGQCLVQSCPACSSTCTTITWLHPSGQHCCTTCQACTPSLCTAATSSLTVQHQLLWRTSSPLTVAHPC